MGRSGFRSQELNPGYGYLWWLNQIGATSTAEPRAPGAPEDTYWAVGAFGQVIQVDPDSETVVVRFGEADAVYDTTAVDITTRILTDTLDS